MKILRLTVFCFLMLQSCIPIYDNVVKYKSPESESGKKCVTRCNYIKNSCYRQCQVNLTNCRLSENMINAQMRSEPFIKIVNNNNVNNNGNATKVDDNDSRALCRSKVEKCKKSCNGSITCEGECDFQMNMCDMGHDFNHSNDFDNFTSEFYEKQNNQVIRVQKSVSLCRINECDKLCKSDYNLCFTDCGGEIITHTKCIAFCNKHK
ncbi:hypothetical protein K6025_04565 [Ehrlichia sp. JZT12]